MPDWRKKEDYAYTKKLDGNGWAFEFLRRNEEYQADYQFVTDVYQELEQKYGQLDSKTKAKWYADLLYWHHIPSLLADEGYDEWLHRIASQGMEPQRIALTQYIMSKWGLVKQLPDPSKPADPAPSFSPTGPFPLFPDYEQIGEYFEGDYPKIGSNGEMDWSSGAGPYAQKYGYAIVVYNLELPLESQLAAAAPRVTGIQKLQKKQKHIDPLIPYTLDNVRKIFKRYLRLIDGKASGATHGELAKTIFPEKDNTASTGYNGTKSVSDSLKAAKRLVQTRYLIIPLLNFNSEQ